MNPKQPVSFFITTVLLVSALTFVLTILIPSSGAGYTQKAGSNRSVSAREQTENKAQLRPGSASEQIKSITNIKTVITPEGEEKVLFYLNGFYTPKVIVLEGEKPRVVCDFYDTNLDPQVNYPIKVNGNLLEQIRIGIYHGKNAKIRVVLDLKPTYDYDVEQTFFMNESIYAIIIKKL